jgi:hypothetical protein
VKTSKAYATLLCLSFFLCSSLQSPAQKLTPFKQAELKALLKLESRLSPQQRETLSQPVRDAIGLAHQLLDPPDFNGGDDDQGELNIGLGSPRGAASTRAIARVASSPIASSSTSLSSQEAQGGLTKISHPEAGLQLSRFFGLSDLESSSAQCGNNIVTSYLSGTAGNLSSTIPFLNDPTTITAGSSIGVSFSADRGSTFTELPFLTVGPSFNDSQATAGTTGTLFATLGNPVTSCTSSSKFFIASSPFFVSDITFLDQFDFTENLFSGVGLNTSTDGGQTWGNTVPTVLKDIDHIIDSGWMVIDPNNPNRMYISYLDFDGEADFPILSHPSPRCTPVNFRIAAELVTSSDGGKTWSSPHIIREDCLPIQQGIAQGFQVASTRLAVSPDGKLSAVFLLLHPLFASDGVTVVDYKLEVHARGSSDNGVTFGPEVKVSDLVQIGDGAHSSRPMLQGFFHTSTIPAIAADPVKRANNKQNLYVVWADGRDNQKPDGTAFFGTYNFGDILISRSTDGGVTWSPPRAVSATPPSFKGAGRDQFIPSIAVDHDGTIAVCYYDRRNDPRNNALDRYCSLSQDSGQSFHDVRESPKSWTFGQTWDLTSFWLGDYDTVAAPKGGDGFFGAFGISGDNVTGIFGRSLQRE